MMITCSIMMIVIMIIIQFTNAFRLREAVSESLHGGIMSSTILFQNVQSIQITQGSCRTRLANIVFSGYVTKATSISCNFDVVFLNGQSCSNCYFTWRKDGANYFLDHGCLHDECFNAVPYYPCQGDGCWWSGVYSFSVVAKPPPPTSQPTLLNLVTGYVWEPASPRKSVVEIKLSQGSSSSSSRSDDTKKEASISLGYGPISASAGISNQLVQTAQSQITKSTHTTTTEYWDACPEKYGRWRFVILLNYDRSISTEYVLCTKNNIKPKCPYSECDFSNSCQTCLNTNDS